MKRLLILAVLTTWARHAQADAMLTGAEAPMFPTRVAIDITVRAQVESTTMVLELPALATAGSYQLTVPPPAGAFAIGVDVDRGAGFVAIPVLTGAPAAGSGGSSDAALLAWQGTAPLVVSLDKLEPGPLTVRVRFVRVLRRVDGQVGFDVESRRCPARATADPGAPPPCTCTSPPRATSCASMSTAPPSSAASRGGELSTGAVTGDVAVHVGYAEVSDGHRRPARRPSHADRRSAGRRRRLLHARRRCRPGTVARAARDQPGDRSLGLDERRQDRAGTRCRARMLDHLRPTDAFAIHAFDDDVDSFRGQPVPRHAPTTSPRPASSSRRSRTVARPISNAGLQAGLAAPPDADRFDAVVLLSDGLATAGETEDPTTILANARREAGDRSRIFTFSVGGDADFTLMEALARGSRGRHVDLNNAQATRDLVARARELFEDIRDVRLTDLGARDRRHRHRRHAARGAAQSVRRRSGRDRRSLHHARRRHHAGHRSSRAASRSRAPCRRRRAGARRERRHHQVRVGDREGTLADGEDRRGDVARARRGRAIGVAYRIQTAVHALQRRRYRLRYRLRIPRPRAEKAGVP